MITGDHEMEDVSSVSPDQFEARLETLTPLEAAQEPVKVKIPYRRV